MFQAIHLRRAWIIFLNDALAVNYCQKGLTDEFCAGRRDLDCGTPLHTRSSAVADERRMDDGRFYTATAETNYSTLSSSVFP